MKNALVAFMASTFLFGKLFLLGFDSNRVFRMQPDRLGRLLVLSAFTLCFLSLLALLEIVGRVAPQRLETTVVLILMLSLFNMTSVADVSKFVSSGKWARLVEAVIGLAYIPCAVWCGFRWSRRLIGRKLIVILLPACLLVTAHVMINFPRSLFAGIIQHPYHAGVGQPVHLIICDSLSWDVLFPQGKIEPRFPHFSKLTAQSHTYLNALPTGGYTDRSVSQLITGHEYANVGFRFNQWEVRTPGSSTWTALRAEETIFASAAAAGYNEVLVGYHLPYTSLLYGLLSYGYPLPTDSLVRQALQSWPRILVSPAHLRHAAQMNAGMRHYLEQLTLAPANTFFYAHLNLPHDPYPYDEDGAVLNRSKYYWHTFWAKQADAEKSYRASVAELDRKLGELMDKLQAEQKFDASLIILTSDHNPPRSERREVPLLIKTPGQQEHRTHREQVDMLRFRNFMDDFFRSGKVNLQMLETQDLKSSVPLPSRDDPDAEDR